MAGVIAAGHPQTVQAGAEMLRRGGNAVDAAVAATFASFITESSLVNIGGGGVAQLFDPTTGQSTVYDFFSTMPGLAGNNAVADQLDFRQVSIDFGATQQAFYIGRGSVAVPGVVAGLCTMLEEAGTMPLAQILAPAIRFARNGVVLSEAQAYITSLLTPIITDTPGIAAIYAPDGTMIKSGETLYFHQLADTLDSLGQQGPELFYTGAVGQAILADQQAHGGLLTATDLARYQVLRSQPIAINYRDYTVMLPTASSVGGPLIAFALRLLANCPLADIAHNEFQHLSILAEIMRLTNIARAAWEGEPDQARLNGHGFKSAANLLADDNIAGYRPKLVEALAGRGVLVEPKAPGGPSNTTHISVADQNGMMVSVTTSAGESAGFVVGDTGVILNNMLGEIDLHPGGFHQLPPGQRLQTMMTPTLVLHRGQPVLAVGSGGSNRIRTAILQTISNVIDFKLDLATAVTAPRVHFEAGEMQLEGGIDPQVADQLEAAGYQVNRWTVRNMFFGGAHAVARREDDHQAHLPWVAVGDERRGGSVAVIETL